MRGAESTPPGKIGLRLIFRLIDCIVGGIETCDNSKEIDANL